MRPVTRRTVLFGLSLGAAAAACDRAEDSDLVLLRSRDTTRQQQFHRLTEQWNREHGDQPVDYVELPAGTDDERRALLEVAQAKNARFDIYGLDVIWLAEFARAGFLMPLDRAGLGLEEFLSRPAATVEFEGQTWGVPSSSNAGLLYYRRDLLDLVDAPPPATWDELVVTAQDVTETARSEHPDIQAYAGQFARYEGLVVNLFEAVWAAGGDVISEDGQIMIGEDEARDGLKRLVDGVRSGMIPPEMRSFDEEAGIQAFAEGRFVFARHWPNAYARLNDPAESEVDGKVSVASLPGPSALGGIVLAVSSHSKHQDAALEFIKFAASEDSQRELLEGGTLPASRTAPYEDAELQDREPYLRPLKEALERARPRPVRADYAYISQAISSVVYEALFERGPEESTDQIVTDAVSELERMLTEILTR